MPSFGRADRSLLAQWWWTVDRLLLASILILALAGLVFSMAASPPVAIKLGLEEFYFVKRQVLFLVVGACMMIGISLLNPDQLRRIALVVVLVGFVLIVLSLFWGVEVKGARRWINFFGFSMQPSEFVKPFFLVLSAWLFSEGIKRPDMPAIPMAMGLLLLFVSLLLLQPDFGQSALICLSWGSLCFLSGMRVIWVLGFVFIGGSSSVLAYLLSPHVAARVDRFLDPKSGDNYQVEKALESVMRGGWLGRGPGEGEVKRVLPDSHTDFIFAATAEEFGVVVCLILLGVFAFIVLRALFSASRERDVFARLSVAGLAVIFGLQSLINMGVNLALLPAKGMTLPFVSSGGSSMLSSFLMMGMILSLTRSSGPDQEFLFAQGGVDGNRKERTVDVVGS